MDLFNDPNAETFGPDPEVVDDLVRAMGEALKRSITPNVTTQADVLSAIFTLLHDVLKHAQETEAPEDRDRNAKEVGRVLADFLMEFGAETFQ